jgi:hypothetical protein
LHCHHRVVNSCSIRIYGFKPPLVHILGQARKGDEKKKKKQ